MGFTPCSRSDLIGTGIQRSLGVGSGVLGVRTGVATVASLGSSVNTELVGNSICLTFPATESMIFEYSWVSCFSLVKEGFSLGQGSSLGKVALRFSKLL